MNKILFIEDEPDQIMMVEMRLQQSGYEVISTMDGETGLKMARQEKPDLILLDIILPKLDGIEVCRQLRQSPETCDIPIIAITAAALKDLVQRCTQAGADDFIRKPYEPEELIARVSKLLDQRRS